LLKVSEDRMAFGAAVANIGFWSLNIQSGSMWASDHCRRMFNIGSNSPSSWTLFRNAIEADDRAIFDGILNSTAHGGVERSKEFRIVRPESTLRWYMGLYRLDASAYDSDRRIVGIFVDVTARKAAELKSEDQRKELT